MLDFINQELKNQLDEKQNQTEKDLLKEEHTCPKCRKGKLEYNSLLNLVCPVCDYKLAGSFT
jgi:ribosomal protein L37AE/L43A